MSHSDEPASAGDEPSGSETRKRGMSPEAVIQRKGERRRAARDSERPKVWFGLGTFGLIGWSVTVPTVAGALIGMWIDARDSGQRSWTLMLMLTGLAAGCVNVWRWLQQQSEA